MTTPKRMLYLAQYAPSLEDAKPEIHPTLGVKPLYHYEVFHALIQLGFQVESCRTIERLTQSPDFSYVFALYYHAKFKGANVLVSALCEHIDIPYLGARPHARAVADDKHLAKSLASHLSIPTPPWRVYRTGCRDLDPPSFKGPYLVKPRCGAGSRGIYEASIQECWQDLEPQVHKLIAGGDDALVEGFIDGINVTVPILGGDQPRVLPIVQLDSLNRGNLVTNRQKKLLDGNLIRRLFEDPERVGVLSELSLRMYDSLRPIDYMRIDFRIPKEATLPPYMIDVNICCNLGSHASLALAGRAAGLTYCDLVGQILDYSFRRQNVGW